MGKSVVIIIINKNHQNRCRSILVIDSFPWYTWSCSEWNAFIKNFQYDSKL